MTAFAKRLGVGEAAKTFPAAVSSRTLFLPLAFGFEAGGFSLLTLAQLVASRSTRSPRALEKAVRGSKRLA